MKHLTNILDKVASELETRGLRKLAAEVDVVANTIEKMAFTETKPFERLEDELLKLMARGDAALTTSEKERYADEVVNHLKFQGYRGYLKQSPGGVQKVKDAVMAAHKPSDIVHALDSLSGVDFKANGMHPSQGLMNKDPNKNVNPLADGMSQDDQDVSTRSTYKDKFAPT